MLLLGQDMPAAFALALAKAGSNNDARIPMNVNALLYLFMMFYLADLFLRLFKINSNFQFVDLAL